MAAGTRRGDADGRLGGGRLARLTTEDGLVVLGGWLGAGEAAWHVLIAAEGAVPVDKAFAKGGGE